MLEELTLQIEKTIECILTTEESYYSASTNKVDRKLAEKILAVFIRRLRCEHFLSQINEDILYSIFVEDLLGSVDPYTEEILKSN